MSHLFVSPSISADAVTAKRSRQQDVDASIKKMATPTAIADQVWPKTSVYISAQG